MFAGKKSAQIREILISESAWEEMTCLFAPSLDNVNINTTGDFGNAGIYNDGELTGSNVTITTTGSQSFGIQNYTNTFNLAASHVETYGEQSVGIMNTGRAELTDTHIVTHGEKC